MAQDHPRRIRKFNASVFVVSSLSVYSSDADYYVSSPSLPVASAGAASSIRNGDPPSEALEAIAKTVEAIKSKGDGADEASSLEPPTCLCGRVMNIAVWEEAHWALVREILKVGSFIRLRNVHEGTIMTGLRCKFDTRGSHRFTPTFCRSHLDSNTGITLSGKSALTPLPNDTFEIKELLEAHQKRVAQKDPYNPQSGVLPLDGEVVAAAGPEPVQDEEMDVDESAHDDVQDGFDSIARCISDPAPKSFKVKFHITGTIPSGDEGQSGLAHLCRSNNAVYQFAVNVNDETAAIDALVPNEVGEALFEMDAAAAALIQTSTAAAIMKEITREDKLWEGDIKSFDLNGSKYFILERISAVGDT